MMTDTIIAIFKELNDRILTENKERRETGAAGIDPIEVSTLGQVTLFANKMVAEVRLRT